MSSVLYARSQEALFQIYRVYVCAHKMTIEMVEFPTIQSNKCSQFGNSVQLAILSSVIFQVHALRLCNHYCLHKSFIIATGDFKLNIVINLWSSNCKLEGRSNNVIDAMQNNHIHMCRTCMMNKYCINMDRFFILQPIVTIVTISVPHRWH